MTKGQSLAIIDLTVRGAGIFGLTVAWAAVRRGARVRVIDPAGVGAGASGGVVGALAPHTPERWTATKTFQIDCLLLARTYWPEVETASGLSTGYRRSGRIQPVETENILALSQERAAVAQAHWRGEAVWEVVRNAPDWAPVSPTGAWVQDTMSAQIDPPRALAALASAITAEGGEIVREGAEEGVVVHATGWAGFAPLSEAVGRKMGGGVKGQAAVLDADLGEIPQIYADSLHIVSHGPGRVAVGSTSEREFSAPDTTDEKLDDVLARARCAVPVLADAPVVARWAGVRPRARTRAPLIGVWPDRPGHVIANGGFKIGYAVAPGLAPKVVELALDGQSTIPETFSLETTLG